MFATNTPDLGAVNVFVDRDGQCEAFDRAVEQHWARTRADDFDVQDVLAPRNNVLVFHGVGGVGKTTLSRALEDRHAGTLSTSPGTWPAPAWLFDTSVTARLDLASEGGLDFEKLLISIRVAVARLGRPMHAFDIAFGRYWDHAHPNESLAAYVRNSGPLARLSGALKLPDQINEGLSEVASALGGSSTLVSVSSQIVKTLVGGVQRGRAKRHAIEACVRLPGFLRSEPDLENLSYYPHLLSWDLGELAGQRKKTFHIVIFVDTFEDITEGEQRRFERLFNRVVWLMPNVLFVISGRNRLDWGSSGSEGQLDQVGAQAWPGLAPHPDGESAQHQVGYLSASDSGLLLSGRLQSNHVPDMPMELRRQIAEDSDGLPLYLHLAFKRYMSIVSSGRSPAAEEFHGGFPQLVTRALRDLTPPERLLIRILTLLDSFDIDLAARIAGLPSEAVALRVAERDFVEMDEAAPFPFSIHRQLRREILRADGGKDAFSPADWERYAQRAFDELGRRYRQAAQVRDRAILISTLNQALRLADRYHLPLGWCTDAAYSFIEDSLWESSLRPLLGTTIATPAAALAKALRAIVDRQETGRQVAVAIFSEVVQSELLTGDDANDLVIYYWAEALREIGQGAESEVLLRDLADRNTRMTEFAVKGLVHRLRRLGRFAEALQQIEARPREGLWLRLSGTVLWSQAMLTEAKADFIASRDWFRRAGRTGDAAEAEGCLAFVCGLIAGPGPENRELVDSALRTLQSSRNVWASLMARLGAVLIDAAGDTRTEAALRGLHQSGEESGLTSIRAYARFGQCLNAILSDDAELIRKTRADLADYVADGDFRWLDEIVGFWTEPARTEAEEPEGPAWLGGTAQSRERWRRVVEARRADLYPGPS